MIPVALSLCYPGEFYGADASMPSAVILEYESMGFIFRGKNGFRDIRLTLLARFDLI